MGWADVLGFGASLFGSGARKEAQRQQKDAQTAALQTQRNMQQQALNMQQEALAPLLSAFTSIGLPGYNAGLKGLMASYGFRPKATTASADTNPAAGTSLGQPPQPEKVMTYDEYIRSLPYVNPNDVDARAHSWLSKDYEKYQGETESKNRQLAAEAQIAATAPSFEGDWGYYGEAGRALGGVTDKYNTARASLQQRAETEGLPPALVEAALNRLDMAEAEENRNLQLDALRQGPMALLNAIAPAFGTGTSGAQIASGNAANTLQAAQQLGTNMLATASQPIEDSSQAYQQLGYYLGQLFSPRPVTAQTDLPSTPPIVPRPTMVNPTTPVLQQTSGLPYVGGPAYTLDDAARRAASLWGFNYTPTAYAQ